MSAGSYEEAFAAYRQAVHLAPRNADAHYSLGAAYNDMAQYGDAFKHFVNAIRLDPDFAEAYYGIGFAYQKLDNFREAVGYLRSALRLRPDYPEARLSLGLALLGLRDVKAAEEQLRLLEAADAGLAKSLRSELARAGAEAEFKPPPRREQAAPASAATPRPAPTPAPAKERARPAATAASLAVELAFWDSVKNSINPEEFAAYLKRYPDGQFSELARIRLRALDGKKGEAPAAAATEADEEPPAVAEQPTDRQTANAQPATTPPANTQSVNAQPANAEPVNAQPVNVRPPAAAAPPSTAPRAAVEQAAAPKVEAAAPASQPAQTPAEATAQATTPAAVSSIPAPSEPSPTPAPSPDEAAQTGDGAANEVANEAANEAATEAASEPAARPATEVAAAAPRPTNVAPANPPAAAEPNRPASLEETVEWLRRNFAARFSYTYTTRGEGPNAARATAEARILYEPLLFQACNLEWRDGADTLSVSLSELDPQAVKVEPRAEPNTTFSVPVWNLLLSATGGARAFREIKGDGSGAMNSYHSVTLQFNDRARADRTARQLQHAINLCGGKPSAF
jgi:hypothetical protein